MGKQLGLAWFHGDGGGLDVLFLLLGVRLALPAVLLRATHLVEFQRNLIGMQGDFS